MEGFEVALDKALADTFNRRPPHRQRFCDPLVRPALSGLKQNPCTGKFTGRGNATAQQLFQLLTFRFTECDEISLFGHRWSPSDRLVDQTLPSLKKSINFTVTDY
jgi:hypothetical protein